MVHYIERSKDVYSRILDDGELIEKVAVAAEVVVTAIRSQKKVLFAGNGGSAADAQHFAAELVSRFNYDRPGMAGIALTTDTSILTAIGNDYGFDRAFARQLEALGHAGDVFVGISTSGRSKNILAALHAARQLGVHTIGLTGGNGGDMPDLCDLEIRIPSDRTPLIQQGHLLVGHILCALVEQAIHPRSDASR
ncbi:D-sedoheptulose 7-phosphate isomerase [Microvirga sp. HBU67558]|nr:D-sedoheptulose 7-phosphate isomerase [Microvirga sp. HBU67558]